MQSPDIDKMERELNWPERPQAIEAAEQEVRHSIAEGILSEHFRHFIKNTLPHDAHQWPVAMLTSIRAREMGLSERYGIIRLTSQSVTRKNHQKRWTTEFEGWEWSELSGLINRGNWITPDDFPNRREVWGAPLDNGKHLITVFKETCRGEFMLMTYHRLSPRGVRNREKMRKEKEDG